MNAEGKRRDIQLLQAAGVPQEQIAKLTGVSVRTIRQIGREPTQPGLAVAEPAATKPAGRATTDRAGPPLDRQAVPRGRAGDAGTDAETEESGSAVTPARARL